MTWNLTNSRMVNSCAVYDLYCDDKPVLSGAGYMTAWNHVLANGDNADTYQEDGMSEAQTVAELREQEAQQQAEIERRG